MINNPKVRFAKEVSIKKIYKDYTSREVTEANCLCPFHEDTNASLSLNYRGRNGFMCFGCGAKGSSIDFVLRAKYNNDQARFMEAVDEICNNYGYIEPVETKNDRIVNPILYNQKKEFSADMANIAKIFNRVLSVNKMLIINEFTARGISEDIQKEYLLGYIPEGISYNTDHDISSLVIAGLCGKDGSANLTNKYIIPLRDEWGNIVGFLGRAKDGQSPKYKVTKSSRYFKLSSMLFNYDVAKKYDTIYVTEGVFDALSLITCGIRNVVAVLGCHLSNDQERLLKDKNIILAFDQDEAGKNATTRFLEETFIPHKQIKILGKYPEVFKDLSEAYCGMNKEDFINFIKGVGQCQEKHIGNF